MDRPAAQDAGGDPGQETVEALLAEAGWVRALSRRLVRDPGGAEDVAQGTLLRGLEAAPRVQDGLRPWLERVARRLARRRLRGELRRADREARASFERSGTTEDDASAAMERFELQRAMTDAIAAMGEPYRSVLVLRFFDGRSTAEIALERGCSPATVRSQIKRGLERLRATLEADLPRRRDQRRLGVDLSLLAVASGSGGPALSKLAAELLVMKSTTKLAAAAAALALAILGFVAWPLLGGRTAPGAGDGDRGDADLARVEAAGRGAGDEELSEVEDGEIREEAEAVVEPEPPAEPAAADAPVVSTVVARLLDPRDHTLADATLAAVRPSDRLRGPGTLVDADDDGLAVLEIEDKHMRKYRAEVFPMIFRAAGPGRATVFHVATPALHGTTDLGVLRLEPGGGLTGLVVGPDGAPVADAIVRWAHEDEQMGGEGPQAVTPLRGPSEDVPRVSVRTGDDGRFTIEGLPVGRSRLWVHGKSTLWTLTAAFPVLAGDVRDVGSLELERVPASSLVCGLVVDPGGSPVSGAKISYESYGSGVEGDVLSDADGRFELVQSGDSTIQMLAVDPSGTFGMSRSASVGGGEEVTLRLSALKTLSISVVDGDGAAVTNASVSITLLEGESLFHGGGRPVPGGSWRRVDARGQRAVDVPDERFRVTVSADGYLAGRAGPFERETTPAEVVVTLEAEPAVTGRVTAGGRPVPGASVYLAQRADGFLPREAGFTQRHMLRRHEHWTTDEDGRYSATIDPDWEMATVMVIPPAGSEELSNGELQITLDPEGGFEDADVDLVAGASIEGTLVPPPGEMVESMVVAASRGDGFHVWMHPDGEGRFRFDGLTPGDWRVEGRLRAPAREILSVARGEEREFRWNALVESGGVARVDVDMRQQGMVEVHGRLLVTGASAEGWSVRVEELSQQIERTVRPAVEIDSSGFFTLQLESGTRELVFEGELPGGARAKITRTLEVVGPRTEWEGELGVASWSAKDLPKGKPLRLIKGYNTGAQEIVRFEANEEGGFEGLVPVGKSSLQVADGEAFYGLGWRALRLVTPGD